jgi:uncharacterized protein (DUF433 family)
MPGFDRVTQSPAQLSGQPCIRGLELSVRQVIEELAAEGSFHDVLRKHPELEDEDLRQALLFAAVQLANGALPVAAEELPFDQSAKPLAQVVEEIIASIPPEEFDKLPADGSVNHDHYLYGWPKKYP